MIVFNWTDMNDDTFNLIKREGTPTSEEVLALGDKGAILVGRIRKNGKGYTLNQYLGGGFDNVIKFVKCTDLLIETNTN